MLDRLSGRVFTVATHPIALTPAQMHRPRSVREHTVGVVGESRVRFTGAGDELASFSSNWEKSHPS